MEYREWYYEVDADRIRFKWVDETQPSNFAGYYIDQAAGGIVHVGFIDNQAEQLVGLEQALSLVATDRLDTYPTTPTVSYLSVRATSQAITNAVDSNSTLKNLIIDVSEDESGGTGSSSGATNVAEVESILGQILGPNAPITVSYAEGDGNLLSGRFATKVGCGQAMRFLIDTTLRTFPPEHIANRMCTAGYGAKDSAVEVAGRTVWRLFVLTAGHCISLNSGFEEGHVQIDRFDFFAWERTRIGRKSAKSREMGCITTLMSEPTLRRFGLKTQGLCRKGYLAGMVI